MTAVAACRSCGTEPLENARFCHSCGSPVVEPDTLAEYKQVTVLFADVVHSMDIAATVGAERLREIMAELVNRAMVVVQRYGATVDQFTGDGIMAVFGAPVALEDHALRACLAALDIQNQTKDLAFEVDTRDGVDLRLRIGLNSGEVIAGEIGSTAVGYTAIGEQVGLAQRMESVAPSGGDAHDALATAASAGTYGATPETLECLAALAVGAGSHREAARLFGAADAIRQRGGLVRFKIFDVFEFAVAALRDGMGDKDFQSAWAEGAALSTEEAIAYAQRRRGERKRPTSGWASLTPTERDVVRLVCEGLANNDIATRLFVSPRTVQTHLTHVYSKLGLNSRVQLAQEAARHG
jgi:class 3 adenylate cyclase/DNA-binding CsgD family transcriptional regulator